MLFEQEIKSRIRFELPQLLPELKFWQIEVDKGIAGTRVDFWAKIETEAGVKRLIVGEIKALGQPRFVRDAVMKLKDQVERVKGSYPVVISSVLGEKSKEICRSNEVGYIDLAGNCYLKFDNVYIHKVVRNVGTSYSPTQALIKRSLKSLFSPVSTRIVRVLLEEPQKGWKLTELAQASQASIGQVYNVSRKLIDEELAKKDKDNRLVLAEATRLLDMWQEQYAFVKNKIRMYYSFERDPTKLAQTIAKIAKKSNLPYALTLFVGASLIAPFIRGFASTDFYIGSEGDLDSWIKALDLRAVESGGNVHILIPYDKGVFYKTQVVEGLNVVSNIQLYLDLYNHPARGREQAEFLREQKIKL